MVWQQTFSIQTLSKCALHQIKGEQEEERARLAVNMNEPSLAPFNMFYMQLKI